MRNILLVILFTHLSMIGRAQVSKGYYREFGTADSFMMSSSAANLDSAKVVVVLTSPDPFSGSRDSSFCKLVRINKQGQVEKALAFGYSNTKFSLKTNVFKIGSKIFLFGVLSRQQQVFLLVKIFDLDLNPLSEQIIPTGQEVDDSRVVKDDVQGKIFVYLSNLSDEKLMYIFDLAGRPLDRKVLRVRGPLLSLLDFVIGNINGVRKYAFFDNAFQEIHLIDTSLSTLTNTIRTNPLGRNQFFVNSNIAIWNDSTVLIAGMVGNPSGSRLFVSKQGLGQNNSIERYVELEVPNSRVNNNAIVKPLDVGQKSVYLGAMFGAGISNSIFYADYNSVAAAIKLDSNLIELWRYTLDSGFYYVTSGVLATDDGGCILYGTKQGFPPQRRLIAWVLKLRADGTITNTSEPDATQSGDHRFDD
jgi:hypothetical protein